MKTLNELLEEGFTYPEDIDEATAELITDWFGERYTGTMFPKFFIRSLNLYYPYYRQLLRVDSTVSKFDWFVDNYEERESKVNEQGTESISKSKTSESETGTVTHNTGTVGLSRDVYVNTDDTTTYDTKDTHNGQAAKTAKQGSLARTAPMSGETTSTLSNTWSMTVDGTTDNPGDIETPGAHVETDYVRLVNPSSSSQGFGAEGSAEKTTDKKEGTDTTESTESTTETSTTTNNLTTNVTGTGSVTDSESHEGENTVDRLLREIKTGRNEAISTLIDKAVYTIQNTIAWEWLYKNLDKCFIQTYIVKGDEYE